MPISFVIAAYNIDRYIEECIQSVEQAACSEDEIIIVNDGSTDCTPELLNDLANHSPLIRVINKKNKGLSSARNVGLQHAQKEYILFLDGDDVLIPDSVHQVRSYLQSQRPDILVTDHQNWLEDGRGETQSSQPRTHAHFLLTRDPTRHLAETLADCIPCVWTRFFKRALFDKLPADPFPEWCMYDDLPTTPYLVAMAQSMLYVPIPLTKYRFRPGSLTQIRTERSCTDMVKAAVHAAQSIRMLPPDQGLDVASDALIGRKLLEAIRQGRDLRSPELKVYREMVNTAISGLSSKRRDLFRELAKSPKKGDSSLQLHLKMAHGWPAGYIFSQFIFSKYKSWRRHRKFSKN